MNIKRHWAVLAAMLLAGCQSLTSHEVATDDQPTMQTAPASRDSFLLDPDEQSGMTVWQRASQSMSMDIPNQADVNAFRDWYLQHPRYLSTVTDRASSYLFLVMEELDKRKMPMELALLPIVESAYNPLARSPSNAVGLWQFTPGTGTRFGLDRNSLYDGRRDIHASTVAALTYLQKLHDDFDGNWLHAIAAYNAGEGRIQQAVDQRKRRGHGGDFWTLNLPRQTTEYVPRLLALADIIKHADKYGIDLPTHPNHQHWEVIDAGGPVSFSVVADMAGLSVDEVRRMNPGYTQDRTPANGPYRLLVPHKGARELQLALAELPRARRIKAGEADFVLPQESDHSMVAEVRNTKGTSSARPRFTTYKVRKGDTLWSISKAHGIDAKQLLSWNKGAKHLHPGQEIKLQTTQTAAKSRPSRSYEVRNGDSLSSIASRFQVSINDLVRWNSLRDRHALKPGQSLVVTPGQDL